jgi:uncharacterized surface protein with fasciclin (FAS1) repeats
MSGATRPLSRNRAGARHDIGRFDMIEATKHDAPRTAAATATTTSAGKTIVETAIADGRFGTLATALTAANLVDTLGGTGPFTVFAPTDAAFAKLPAGRIEALLGDVPTLTGILTHHVVPGRITAADLKTMADKDGVVSAKTVNGQMLRIKLEGGKVHVGAGAPVQVSTADVAGSNGVIHVIDGVLLPQG